MGLIDLASEQYPLGTDVDLVSVGPKMSSICLSISFAQRMAEWYCLCSSSISEEIPRVLNEAMA